MNEPEQNAGTPDKATSPHEADRYAERTTGSEETWWEAVASGRTYRTSMAEELEDFIKSAYARNIAVAVWRCRARTETVRTLIDRASTPPSSPARSVGNGGAQEDQSMKTKTSNAEQQDGVMGSAFPDCPFCGATADALDKRNGKGVYAYMNAPGKSHESTMHVACLECGSGSPSIEVWSRRQPADSSSETAARKRIRKKMPL